MIRIMRRMNESYEYSDYKIKGYISSNSSICRSYKKYKDSCFNLGSFLANIDNCNSVNDMKKLATIRKLQSYQIRELFSSVKRGSDLDSAKKAITTYCKDKIDSYKRMMAELAPKINYLWDNYSKVVSKVNNSLKKEFGDIVSTSDEGCRLLANGNDDEKLALEVSDHLIKNLNAKTISSEKMDKLSDYKSRTYLLINKLSVDISTSKRFAGVEVFISYHDVL